MFQLLESQVKINLREINLIHHRNDNQVMLDGQIGVGQSLSLNSLRDVNDQHRSFTGGQATRNFIGKIDMTGSINHVEDIFLAGTAAIFQSGRLCLDGDTTFPLDVHSIQDLFSEFTARKSSR